MLQRSKFKANFKGLLISRPSEFISNVETSNILIMPIVSK